MHFDSRSVRWLMMAVLLAMMLAGAWWAYYPGLSGGFQFDDFANLPAIGATGPVDTWPTFWRYITSGHADPTGRPLALLSFLVDAHNWPASPRPFLRTSILLHLFNGVLLFVLLRRLGFLWVRRGQGASGPTAPPTGVRLFVGGAVGPDATRTLAWRIHLAALLGAGLWLLHPLFVSATLYIVQREAMLPATFTLLGLLAWLHGRQDVLSGRTWRGLAWMGLGLWVCTALAVLSKANGILLPALALVIEWTLLAASRGAGCIGANGPSYRSTVCDIGANGPSYREMVVGGAVGPDALITHTGPVAPGHAHRTYRRALWVLAGLPAVFVALYLLHAGYNGFVHGVSATRPWTEGQRLLTEPRVLMDYLKLLWLPRPFTPGLFNDQIHASTSLLAPWTTLPCLLAVLGLIVGACVLRKRWPVLAMAVLFYFVGQAVESSTIALELYFEHRNYLPAMLMFWPLALWLCGVRQSVGVRNGKVGANDFSAAGDGIGANGPSYREKVVGGAVGPDAESHVGGAVGPDAPAPADGSVTPAPKRTDWRWAKAVFALLILAGLAAMTHARTSVWGNTQEQALLWARLNPDSPRAQANAAMTQMHHGHSAQAAKRLKTLLAQRPDQVQLAFNLFAAQCRMGRVPSATMQAAKTALATTRNPGALLAHWFGRAIGETRHAPCPQLTLDTLVDLVHAAQSNPRLMAVKGRRQDLDSILGRIALARGKPDAALTDFNRALDQDVRLSAALEQAALLGSHGYPRRGLAHLDHYQAEAARHPSRPGLGMPRIHAWVLEHQQYWQHELVHLRQTLRQDAAHKAAHPSRDPPGQ